MIPPPFYEAIVEIRCGARWGTGFLVTDDGLILTAKHVVEGGDACEVRFPGGGPMPGETRLGARDWAVVKVSKPPAGVRPIPLAPLEPVSGRVAWSTAGYARLRGGAIGGFHGVIRVASAAEIALACGELIGARHEDACGLSGGPCIVDGAAVGVITDVIRRGDASVVVGEVMALPIEVIRQETTLPIGDGEPSPWEHVFTGRLERLPKTDLRSAAELAGLAEPIDSPRLPQQVARRMLHSGLRTVVRVLGNLIDPELARAREDLLRLAESLWVDALAASRLKAVAVDNRPSRLVTERDWAARHYLHRARAYTDRGAKEWKFVTIRGEHEEPFLDNAMTALDEELRRALRASELRMLKQSLSTADPVTAFVFCQPRVDLVDRVRTEWPGLRVVFLSRASSTRVDAGIEPILPEVSIEVEDEAWQEIGEARDELQCAGR